jgi:hypothetical protein
MLGINWKGYICKCVYIHIVINKISIFYLVTQRRVSMNKLFLEKNIIGRYTGGFKGTVLLSFADSRF